MFTYNSFLYVERNKRHLSRRKMAKLLHIGRFNYLMIEEGYFKPTKRRHNNQNLKYKNFQF